MEEEMKYCAGLQKDFLKVCNSKYEQDEYYYVIMGVNYDSYDNVYFTTTDIYVDVPRLMNVRERGLFGSTRTVTKEVIQKEKVGIYAIRNRNGIYEMTTGKKLSLNGQSNSIHCFGISRVSDNCLETVSRDLQLLDSNPKYKQQYINSLMALNSQGINVHKKYDEMRREQNANLQYLRRYKLQNNQ